MGEKQAILKMRKEWKLIRVIGQILGIPRKIIWNVLKKGEIIGVLSNKHWTRKKWKKYCESCKENPQNICKWRHKLPQCKGVRYHNPLFKDDSESRHIKAIPPDTNHSLARRVQRWPPIFLEHNFWWTDEKLISTKVMESGERKDIGLWSKAYKLIYEPLLK